MRSLLVIGVAFLGAGVLPGCSAPAPQGGCTPGQMIGCVCADGRAGAQRCEADKTYGVCSCAGASGDLGGGGGGDLGGGGSGDLAVSDLGGGDLGANDLAVVVKRVFVTSTGYVGDLQLAGLGGGAAAADRLCDRAAQGAGLAGTFRAWIADNIRTSALAPIVDVGPWYLVDRTTKVFNNRAQVATTPLHAINMDEKGAGNLSECVWTGAAVGGNVSGFSCLNWASASMGVSAAFGLSDASDGKWTNFQNVTCQNSCRLYCFEQ